MGLRFFLIKGLIMKKLLSVAALSVAVLTGCAGGAGSTAAATGADVAATGVATATNIGMGIFKVAVDTKCRTELNNQALYKTATLVLNSAQKEALETKVCGCVSEQAPQSVTIAELTQAAVSPAARTQVVASAVANTINACVTNFVTGQ